MTITMTHRMGYVLAMALALGSLAMVTEAGSEEQLHLDNTPLDQSQIDQFLHTQIIKAGLSTKGLGGVSLSTTGLGRSSGSHINVNNGSLKIDLGNTFALLGNTFTLRSDIEAKNRRGAKACRTHFGGEGACLTLSDCPALLLDFNALVGSVCFNEGFRPGVCCPIINKDPTQRPRPTKRPTTNEPRPTPSTTTRPRPVPTVESYPCGQRVVSPPRGGRIINGNETYPGEWPWAAAIFLHGNMKKELWCGGSLISKRYIMTSAHCLKDKNRKTWSPLQLSVRIGDHNIFSTEDDAISYPRTYRVDNIKIHPENRGFYNDLALLKLDQDVVFTDYISPVCLPSDAMVQAMQDPDHLQGYYPTVVGWGKTEGGKESPVLLKTSIPIWRNQPCEEAYKNLHLIEKTHLCAGFIEGLTDACQGDSGGPLSLYTGLEWTQIGVVSFGKGCAIAEYPGVYTRLTEFVSWIKLNANIV